ncbi:hypothetical protein F2Q68_00043889 [Brassica cretica]|uniref:Uncharacterized protein n=1 Tax=Brassica cretica TaxID=69181 RepID=A0A8S9LLM2_BRACR|nr:hypothetical protein F2Q68_00043889 [Brassica cretica]
MGRTHHPFHGTPMKPLPTLHPPSRLFMPLRVESGLLPSLLDICVCSQAGEGGSLGVPAQARTFPPYIEEGVVTS